MSAGTHATADGPAESRCWCCGRMTAEDGLTRLGKHPEVGVCVNCARFLSRRARDIQASAMRRQLRGAAESVRGHVMSRGWHQHPVFGPALRWINQHVPW